MKKIIDGRHYNTETSARIAEIQEGSREDLTCLDCALYRAVRSKDFFLAGYGGPLTAFGRKGASGFLEGSERVIPLSDAQALECIRKYADPEAILEHYAQTVE